MKKLLLILITIASSATYAQTIVSGKVATKKGEPIPFANVSLKKTYDGGSADDSGMFSFETYEEGEQVLTISMIGYLTQEVTINVQAATDLSISLKEEINALNAVVVTAGSFEASDSKRMVMLKPLDIVTTAGGGADITAVMQLLPGANRVGETEGLFVRGGSANETKTIIDGMIVQNPFFSSTPDVPQRGRFNPFMFKGTSFSTGGYSAKYGQALSSVLLLETQDKIGSNSNWNINANMAGASASYTHKGWITANIGYSNLTPFFELTKMNLDFTKVPQGLGGSVTINENLNDRNTVKAYVTYTNNESGLLLPSYDSENSKYEFTNQNKNLFSNASLTSFSKNDKWSSKFGVSVSDNRDILKISSNDADRLDKRSQVRWEGNHYFGNNLTSSLSFGVEHHRIELENIYNEFALGLRDNYSASFIESEIYLSPKVALRVGIRGEHSSYINRFNIAPRFSMAYKINDVSQFSFAGGRFYQNPEKEYLYLNPNLDFEIADHLILNYQIIKNKRTFRVEAFYKNYDQLVVEKAPFFDPNPFRFPVNPSDNSGEGYAQGFDIFFRDQKTIKNADVWISYSFLDTERFYRNYTSKVVPHFASKHNWSVVYKQWLPAINTSVGATFTHTSGRAFYDWGNDSTPAGMTPNFQNLSLMASKVRQRGSNFFVFYLAVDNVLARKNVFGFRFSEDGKQRFEVRPPVYRTFFAGISWSFGTLDRKPKEASLDI